MQSIKKIFDKVTLLVILWFAFIFGMGYYSEHFSLSSAIVSFSVYTICLLSLNSRFVRVEEATEHLENIRKEADRELQEAANIIERLVKVIDGKENEATSKDKFDGHG